MTTQNHPIKIGLVALMLCLLMLCPMLLACDEGGSATTATTTTTNTTATTTTPSTTTTTTPQNQQGSENRPVVGEIKTTLTQLELDDNGGMCYVIQLADGRFIVIDGGYKSANHRNRLRAYLDEHSPTPKAVIACWLITHLDPDHTENMYDFLLFYRNSVDVQCIAYTHPLAEDFPETGTAISVMTSSLAYWKSAKRWFPNAELWDMQRGDVKNFGDVSLQVLMTANERVPVEITSHNQRSAVVKFTFTQGTADTADDKTFMMMGDNGGGGGESNARNKWLVATYGAAVLKSDVLQVVHHGLVGGYLPLYQAIDPSICLWPTHEERFAGRYDADGDGSYSDDYQYCTQTDYNKWLRNNSIRVRQHYHHSQTTIIDMSDLSVDTSWKMQSTS